MGLMDLDEVTLEQAAQAVRKGFGEAATAALPERWATASHPWISDDTLFYIDKRIEARRAGNADKGAWAN